MIKSIKVRRTVIVLLFIPLYSLVIAQAFCDMWGNVWSGLRNGFTSFCRAFRTADYFETMKLAWMSEEDAKIYQAAKQKAWIEIRFGHCQNATSESNTVP